VLRILKGRERVKEGEKKEGTNVYLWLIHVDVWQKTTQHCKAIKKNKIAS